MYIDLSLPLRDNMPVYPGDPAVQILPAATFAEQGYSGHDMHIGNHTGTHIDAAAHMIEGGQTIDQYPLEQFFGRCSYIPYEQTLDQSRFAELDIRAGDIVVIDTGMWTKFESPEYFTDYPVITTVFAEYVAAQNVHMIGLDTCSVDNADGFPVHKILLGSGILVAENLTNVTELKDKKFTITALPISCRLDAAPARILATSVDE